MSTGLKPVWAGRNMRLDPFRLPQVVSYATRDDFGDVTFTIDHRGAIVKRILQMSGLPATVVLPAIAAFSVSATWVPVAFTARPVTFFFAFSLRRSMLA